LSPDHDALDRALKTLNVPASASTDDDAALRSFLAALSSPQRATLRSTSLPAPTEPANVPATPAALRLTTVSAPAVPHSRSNPLAPVLTSKPLVTRTQSLAPAFDPAPGAIRRTMSVGGKSLPSSFAREAATPLELTQPQHTQPSSGSTGPANLIAASVEGMGRVALRADVLVASLGPEPAGQAIAAAATATLGAPFGHVAGSQAEERMTQNRNMFADVFGVDACALGAARQTLSRSRSPHPSMSRNKLERVQSWLESPDMSGPEDEADGPASSHAGWITIPKAWDRDSAALAKAKKLAKTQAGEVKYVDLSDESDDEERARPEVRVGGKNIRMLVNTKRRRSDQQEGSRSTTPVDPSVYKSIYKKPTPAKTPRKVSVKPATASPVPPPRGRGKAIIPPAAESAPAEVDEDQDVIDCLCGRDEEGDEGMIQCDACQSWLHLVCIGFGHRQRFPRVWTCPRCVDKRDRDEQPSATKRARQTTPAPEEFVPVRSLTPDVVDPVVAKRERETTPALFDGPVLVPSSASRGEPSFLNASTMTLALAPSPTASPIRCAVPRSPVSTRRNRHSSAVTPHTPTLTLLSSPARPGDLGEPSSPLYHRGGRIRMISSVVNDPPSDVLAAGWSAGWDAHNSYGLDSHERTRASASAIDEDDILGVSRSSSWHDLNMTPSRTLALSSMAYAAHSPSTGRRSRQLSGPGGAFGASSAQDFLSSLHTDEPSTHAVAQRLFGGPSPSRSAESALLSSPGNHAHLSSSPASAARRSVGMAKRILSGGQADWATGSEGLDRGREVFSSPSGGRGRISRGESPSPVGTRW